jgi:hypothetical protein
MAYANFQLKDGRRVCLRCASSGHDAFAWAVDKWTRRSGWSGYRAISQAVALRMMALQGQVR